MIWLRRVNLLGPLWFLFLVVVYKWMAGQKRPSQGRSETVVKEVWLMVKKVLGWEDVKDFDHLACPHNGHTSAGRKFGRG